MSGSQAMLAWLEDKSDWLSPVVVKEVRQMACAREFVSACAASLLAGLGIAFFGAADALAGAGTTGRWTFSALMSCLGILGLLIVPLSAFSAMRVERLEQTLDLVVVTALSPRRIVIGKLFAQCVKLATLFAAMAPFIAMSFLLGGVDFVTIVVSLGILFLWSMWMAAAGLFLSSLFKARAMLGLVVTGGLVALFVILSAGRVLLLFLTGAAFGIGPVWGFGGSDRWWVLAIMTTFCLASMVNLLLLAENRLSLPMENRVGPLRAGFLVQFLLIVGWTLTFINAPARISANALDMLVVFGGLHLAVVAAFTVTEDFVVSRRALLRMRESSPWDWLLAIFRPGGGRGAAYVLAQMAVLLLAAALFQPAPDKLRWAVSVCAYICCFTGVPTYLFRRLKPAQAASLRLRVLVLLLVPASLILPDLVYYVVWRPDLLDLRFSARHLINPFRTLANWRTVEERNWFPVPAALGLVGLFAYVRLIHMGMRFIGGPVPADSPAPARAAGESGNANVLY